MRLTEVVNPLDPVALRYTMDVLEKITAGIVGPADPFGIDLALASPLLQPEVVAKAFGLRSPDEARVLLGSDPVLSAPISVPTSDRALTTLDDLLRDEAGVAALAEVRAKAIDAVRQFGEGQR
jgi:hypothetical protein